MMSIFKVAAYIADKSDWSLSNLSLQKLTYIAQMFYLGANGRPLFQEDFEAWDYGPVCPDLYHDLKMFGSDPIARYSSLSSHVGDFDISVISTILDPLVKLGVEKKPGQLVSITHWKDGAWAKSYMQGIKGIQIPKSMIEKEYSDRKAA
jgi:uncharacterized phage-associated protein